MPKISATAFYCNSISCIAVRYSFLSILLQSVRFLRFFHNQIQPNASTSTVSFHKRMSNVYFNVLFYYVFKRIFGHFFDQPKIILQKHGGSKRKIAFAILSVRICPAKSYNPPNKYAWICCKFQLGSGAIQPVVFLFSVWLNRHRGFS